MSRGRSGPTLRTFVAVELEATLRARLRDELGAVRDQLPGLRTVPPDNVHLTLRFLGDSTVPQLERLRGELERLARGCPAGDARVAALGMFPEHGAPRVLWLGLELPPALLGLQADCERAARAAGFEREPRPFQPHVTLGRWRERCERPRLPPLELGRTRLATLTLFRSELQPAGSRYTPLASFPLAAPA